MLSPARAEILQVAIPFRFTFQHSLAERAVGEGVLLVVHDREGRSGYGECTPRSYVSGETAESVLETLERRLAGWLGHNCASFEDLQGRLTREAEGLPRAEHAAACSLELALLDLGGKVFGRSAGEALGPPVSSQVAYSGVISAGGEEGALQACELMKKLGVARAKIKVGATLEQDLRMLTLVRESLGEAAALRVDANCAWDARTALARIEAFEEFRLEGVEQPCGADDFEGSAWLCERSAVPVIADEALVSFDDAKRLIAARACHVFNVRISKCGGLLSAVRIRKLGQAAGIGTMLGAHVGETAILAAAGRHFAARSPGLRFAEGSYGSLLLADDVSRELDLEPGGVGTVPAGDGLGLEVDLGRIDAHVVARRTLP